MAFADPQSVTIAGVATSLPRTSSGSNGSIYTSADGNVRLVVSHAIGKRNRRTIRLEHRKVAADPFTSSLNAEYSMTAYAVFDVPKTGYTVAQQKEVVDALVAYLAASTGAQVTKILGGEN